MTSSAFPPGMTLSDYISRYGASADALALELLRRMQGLSPAMRAEVERYFAKPVEQKTLDMSDLLQDAAENLSVARRMRDSLIGADGKMLGTPAEMQKALAASDKALQTAVNRYKELYSVSSYRAVEETVKQVLAELPEDQAEDFLRRLEDALEEIR